MNVKATGKKSEKKLKLAAQVEENAENFPLFSQNNITEKVFSLSSDAVLPAVISLPRSIPPHLPFQGYKRKSTITVALPSSIISNIQRDELKAYLVGEIARSLTIFGVDAVIIYEDFSTSSISSKTSMSPSFSQELEFFVRNLQYLETPQYLRRKLFPMHPDFKFAGLQNPIDSPHHLRRDEWLPYREGVVIHPDAKTAQTISGGSWVYCGLFDNVWIPQKIKEGVRVTVKLKKAVKKAFKANAKKRVETREQNGTSCSHVVITSSDRLVGTVVSPADPPSLLGLYWGYTVLAKSSLYDVLQACPFSEDGSFDLYVGTSQNGINVNKDFSLPKYQNMLLIFGAIDGLESVLASAQGEANTPEKFFDLYLNVCPLQRSRTIRTEEALPIALSVLRPHVHANDL